MTDDPYDYIAEAITEHWGERCSDYEPQCACCAAWAQYDALAAKRAPVDKARLALDYRGGTPLVALASRYGCSVPTVYSILGQMEEPLRGLPPVDPAVKARAVRMYRDGEKLAYIAALLHISKATVIKCAKAAGVFGRAKRRAA